MNEEPTIGQLKAYAYDCLANVEAWQARLREANQKIAELASRESKVVEPKKENDAKTESNKKS